MLPRRGWAVVIVAAVVAGAALFVGPSVTGLSVLGHVLVVGAVEAGCALAIIGTVLRYTSDEQPGDDEWRYDS